MTATSKPTSSGGKVDIREITISQIAGIAPAIGSRFGLTCRATIAGKEDAEPRTIYSSYQLRMQMKEEGFVDGRDKIVVSVPQAASGELEPT